MSFQGLSFDISSARFSELDEDGFLHVQVAGYAGDKSENTPVEMHSPFGFLSRPDDPDPDGKGCTVLYTVASADGGVWLGSDPRYTPKVPPPKKGGSVVYAKTGAFANLDGDHGSYTLYVPYHDADKDKDVSMLVSLDVSTSGKEVISVVHGSGTAVFLSKAGVTLKNAAGNASITVNDAGITLNGNVSVNGMALGGKQLMALLGLLGANTKPPTPVPPSISIT